MRRVSTAPAGAPENIGSRRLSASQGAREHLDRRAFASTVRAEKSEDRAAAHGERKAPYGNFGSVNFAQVLCLNRKAIRTFQRRFRIH